MSEAAGGVAAALAERAFRGYRVSKLLSLLGDALMPVALTFAILGSGGSVADLGLLLAAALLPQVVLLGPGGVLADRVSRARLLVVCDVVRGCAQLATGTLLMLHQSWLLIAVSQLLLGSATAVFRPAALIRTSTTVSAMVGPLIAALLVTVAQPGLVVAMDGVTYLTSAALLLLFRVAPRTQERRRERQDFRTDMRAGLEEVRARPWIWMCLISNALLLVLVTSPFLVLGPLVAQTAFHGASTWASWLVAFSIGELGGSYLAARVKPERPVLWACAGLFLLAIPPLLMSLPAPAVAIAVAETGAGMALGWHAVLWSTAIQSEVPEHAMSRVGAPVTFGSFALLPLGLAFTGPFAQLIGVPAVFWLATAWTISSTAALVAAPSVRNLRLAVPRSPVRAPADSA